jgi:serine/threonine protein kinase
MSLASGSRLGAYEIISLLGAGGMGQVYRATDTLLKRQVALKVLPPEVANDPDRVARFQREAEVLASLNHPNIAHLYGLERSGGTLALVMELVEGPTLADRIGKGAISIDEALPIAKQIAEALEAAHEHGIIHRDLKPANIKVREDGTIKVLDFGLAKAMEVGTSGASSAALANSPTITSPALMTGIGVLLGTAAYMSPEQARGKTVDRRADIWAFGVVLFEMLSGRRAFDGDDLSITLASVLKTEPDWQTLPSATGLCARTFCTVKGEFSSTGAEGSHVDGRRKRFVRVERRPWTVDDYPRDDDGTAAAALRLPASGSRPTHRGRHHRHESGRPALDGSWMAPQDADGRRQSGRDESEDSRAPAGSPGTPATREEADGTPSARRRPPSHLWIQVYPRTAARRTRQSPDLAGHRSCLSVCALAYDPAVLATVSKSILRVATAATRVYA